MVWMVVVRLGAEAPIKPPAVPLFHAFAAWGLRARPMLMERPLHLPAASMKPQNVRTFAVVALAVASIYLLRSLVAPIVWAALIAIATWPLHDRLRDRLAARYEIASAMLLTGAVVLFLAVPIGYISQRAWHELPALTRLWASSKEAGLPAPDWVATLPMAGAWAARQWNETLGEPGALSAGLHTLLGSFDIARGRTLVAFVGHHAMAFFFCVVVLFFFYLDGDALAAQIDAVVARFVGPAGQRTRLLVVQSIRGAVNGLVLVGLGLGVLMTVAYVVAGVPHPAALGLATGLLGMVPFGAMVVLALVVLYLLALGSTTAAVALAVFGVVAIFIADHFIRPVLMAGAAKLPLVLALLGIIGGLETFGVLGLFLGPTLLAVVAAVWRELAAPAAAPTDVSGKPTSHREQATN